MQYTISTLPSEHIVAKDVVRLEFLYSRKLPDIWSMRIAHQATAYLKLSELLRDQVVCSAEFVFTLRDVCVLAAKHIVTPERGELAETFTDADLSSASRERLADPSDVTPWPKQKRTPVQIAKEGAGNYGHTLTEILPKLVNLARVLRNTLFVILLPREAQPFLVMYELCCGLRAALTNILFAPASCHVAMIDPGLVDLFFWDLACLKGQAFSLAVAHPIREWSVDTLLSDFHVEVGFIREMARNLKTMTDDEHRVSAESGGAAGSASASAPTVPPPLSIFDSKSLTCLAPCFWGDLDQLDFLKDVRRLIAPFGERGAFAGDNMIVFGRNLSFLEDDKFLAAFRHYIVPENNVGYAIMWRLYTFCWAAKNGLRREGDFVECGVFSGTSSAIMCRYLDFEKQDKKLYLFDIWEEDERVETTKYPGFDSELFKAVTERFSPFPNVQLRKGFIPDSFAGELPESISFLHIDLNNAAAEIAVLDEMFDRVSPGGIVLFDDYGSSGYTASKIEEDKWMRRKGYDIIELPTSQGMVIK